MHCLKQTACCCRCCSNAPAELLLVHAVWLLDAPWRVGPAAPAQYSLCACRVVLAAIAGGGRAHAGHPTSLSHVPAAAAHLIIIYPNHEEERSISSVDDLVASVLKNRALHVATQFSSTTVNSLCLQLQMHQASHVAESRILE